LRALRDLATDLDLLDQVAATRLGIGRSDLRCLDVLSRRGPLGASALAAAVGLSPPALSAAMRRLERAGYLRRDRHPDDQRTVQVSITEAAATKTAPLYGELLNHATEVLARRDPAQLSALTELLTEVSQAVQDLTRSTDTT
jgi:DNA-binding MarR family transcriptional regulator